jgi:hypothetical protein
MDCLDKDKMFALMKHQCLSVFGNLKRIDCIQKCIHFDSSGSEQFEAERKHPSVVNKLLK